MPPLIADRYDVVRTLGEGSFGRTFLAVDTTDGRNVAIKMFDARGGADWKAFELFEREALVLRSLRHQGIPEVFATLRAAWEGADAPFLVMEYVEGTSLAEVVESHRHFEYEELLHVFLELLGILEYLHGRVPPILHRDIKPPNIIIRPNGFPALVDFGSVRRVFLAPDESGSTVAGTYGYMPYEQYMGQASPSSDLYAVAATILHLVTGRPPRDFMVEGRLEVPSDLPGDSRLRDVLARMLRPTPSERFANAADVRNALLAPTITVALDTTHDMSRRRVANLSGLPPAPRPLESATEARWKALSYSWWRFADSAEKVDADDGYDIVSLGVFALVSVATFGIMPAIFASIARERRRRLRKFFVAGAPAIAEITAMREEPTAFGAKRMRVNYDFYADGLVRRDSDVTLPVVADRWKVGDQIEILYIADRDYDSVIISG